MTKHPLLQVFPSQGGGEPSGRRTESLVAIVNHCAAAKTMADQAGNKFLAYLLAMTLQEARTNLGSGDEEIAFQPASESTFKS